MRARMGRGMRWWVAGVDRWPYVRKMAFYIRTYLLLVEGVKEDDSIAEGVIDELLQRQAHLHAGLLQDFCLCVFVRVYIGGC